jgi:hypothetical protein
METTKYQAKSKFCPLQHIGNGRHNINGTSKCVANTCVLWRWKDNGEMEDDSLGYCGLGDDPYGP